MKVLKLDFDTGTLFRTGLWCFSVAYSPQSAQTTSNTVYLELSGFWARTHRSLLSYIVQTEPSKLSYSSLVNVIINFSVSAVSYIH